MEHENRIFKIYSDHIKNFIFPEDKLRLAFVDDIPAIVWSTSLQLCSHGCQTTGFYVRAGWSQATEQEIEELASRVSHACDVAIVDYSIDGVDTQKLLTKLKDKGKVVVILSGISRRMDEFDELKNLAHLYLEKPMDEEKILQKINEYLAKNKQV